MPRRLVRSPGMRVSSSSLAAAVAVSLVFATGCEEPSLGSPSGRVVVRHGPGSAAPAVAARLMLAANRRTDALFNAGGGIDRVQVTRNGLELQAKASWRGPTLVELSFDDAPEGDEAIYLFQGLTAAGRPVGASQSVALATKRTLDMPSLQASATASAIPSFTWNPVPGASGYYLEFASPESMVGTRIFIEVASTSYRYGDPAADSSGDRAVPAALQSGYTYGIRLAAYAVADGEGSYAAGGKVQETVSQAVSISPPRP